MVAHISYHSSVSATNVIALPLSVETSFTLFQKVHPFVIDSRSNKLNKIIEKTTINGKNGRCIGTG